MAKIISERKQSFPNEPWRWRDDWESARLSTENRSAMIGWLAFAIFWNAVALPLTLLVLPGELRDEHYAALLVLVFPLVGLYLCVTAFQACLRFSKYGESTFRMAANPGVVGGTLTGVVEAYRLLNPTKGFRLQLSCISRSVCGTGRNRRVRQNVLWQSMQTTHCDLGNDSGSTVIPVQFSIPFDAKSSSQESDAEERVYWTLEVKAEEPGVDYLASFELPVFRTSDSDPNFQVDQALLDEYVHVPSIDEVYDDARLLRRETQHGIELHSPLFRDTGKAIGTTIFTLLWIGGTSLFGYSARDAGGLGVFIALFVAVFALFGILLLIIAIDLWLWRSNNKITQRGIESHAGILGFTRTRTFPRDQIKKIAFKKSMQSGMTIYYDLNLETVAGKKHSLARRVANESTARSIVADIEQHLGLASEVSRSSAELTDSQRASAAPIIPAVLCESSPLGSAVENSQI